MKQWGVFYPIKMQKWLGNTPLTIQDCDLSGLHAAAATHRQERNAAEVMRACRDAQRLAHLLTSTSASARTSSSTCTHRQPTLRALLGEREACDAEAKTRMPAAGTDQRERVYRGG